MLFPVRARLVLGLMAMMSMSVVLAQSAAQPARVIVRLKPTSALLVGVPHLAQVASASDATHPMRRLGARVGLQVDDVRQMGGRTHVATASGMTSEQLVSVLSRQADVEQAVVDRLRLAHATTALPNDPLYPASVSNPIKAGQWYLRAPDSVVVSAINAPAAWALTTGSSNVVVAVIDTGARFEHPDLNAKWLAGYDMITEAVRANNGGQGRNPDATDFGDWLTSTEISANPTVYAGCTPQATSSWHGTQVASIIGASSNTSTAVGMASVAWDSPILPVRALGKCGGYDSDIVDGMRWAAGLPVLGLPLNPKPASVLNLSLGGAGPCDATSIYPSVIAELTAQKVVVVSSAGNDQGLAVSSPANCSGVIAVAGLRHAGTKVGFSSLGPEVTVSAPAGNCLTTGGGACVYPILTAINKGATTPDTSSTGSDYSGSSPTNAAFGTSFSAPQVSGTVALMLARRPDLSNEAVIQIIKNTARAFPSTGGSSGIPVCQAPTSTAQNECYCTTTTCGAGMLDAGLAVAAATQPVALIHASASPAVGQTVTLDGSASLPGTSASNNTLTYAWAITSGAASITGAASGSSISLTPSAPGVFTVNLAITDSMGARSQTTQSFTASGTATPIVTPPSTGSSASSQTSSSGGGGAWGGGLAWSMVMWLALGMGLRRTR